MIRPPFGSRANASMAASISATLRTGAADAFTLSDEAAAGEIADQALVDWRILEREVVDVFGERQLGDRELVFDRARLLFGDLGAEQIADDARRLVPALKPVLIPSPGATAVR